MNQHNQAVFIFRENLLLTANSEALRLIEASDENDIIGLPFEAFFAEELDRNTVNPRSPFHSPLTLIGRSEAQRYPATLVLDDDDNKLLVILSSEILPGPVQQWMATDLGASPTLIGHWVYTPETSNLWWG